jgi:putative FmdB family regulatory protein
MPIYDYTCQNCGYQFETNHSMFIDPLKICPICNKDTLLRDIGTPRTYIKPSDDSCSLGLLADRNRDRFSDDQKEMLKEKHRTKKTHRIVAPGKIEPI